MNDGFTITAIIASQIKFARENDCSDSEAALRIVVELDRKGYTIFPEDLVATLAVSKSKAEALEVMFKYVISQEQDAKEGKGEDGNTALP